MTKVQESEKSEDYSVTCNEDRMATLGAYLERITKHENLLPSIEYILYKGKELFCLFFYSSWEAVEMAITCLLLLFTPLETCYRSYKDPPIKKNEVLHSIC